MTRYTKAIVAFVVAALAGAVAQGLIVGESALWVSVIIGALATAGVYTAPNKPPEDDPPQ
jgi:uncharacterized membrane protein YoaK (UPF0700 family)